MNRRRHCGTTLLMQMLAGTVAWLACTLAHAAPPLVMGIFPRMDAIETTRMFQPLAKYLSEKTGREVVLETTKDFESFWRGVTHKRYDIVHYNQYHYLKSHKESGYQVIAKNVEQGQSTIGAALVVRADSNIRSIADLRGRTVVFGGDRRAMQAYVVTTYMLRKGGLRPGDYAEEFSKNPPNAVMTTFFRQADAAGAGDHVLDLPALTKEVDVQQLRYLATSEPLPHLPWAVRGDMPRELRMRVQQSLIDLNKSPAGRAMLKHMGIDGFVAASDAEYDKHRRIIKEVMGEDY